MIGYSKELRSLIYRKGSLCSQCLTGSHYGNITRYMYICGHTCTVSLNGVHVYLVTYIRYCAISFHFITTACAHPVQYTHSTFNHTPSPPPCSMSSSLTDVARTSTSPSTQVLRNSDPDILEH